MTISPLSTCWGDLLARAGEKRRSGFLLPAHSGYYREKEFRLKAIAMYRKIEKLKPRDRQPRRSLLISTPHRA